MSSYVATGVAAMVAGYILTAAVLLVIRRLGIYDIPRDRKVHRVPKPTLGGISLYLACVAGGGFAGLLGLDVRGVELAGVLAGGLIALVMGIADDRRDLRTWKFVGQIAAGSVLAASGVQISALWLPIVGVFSLTAEVAFVLTVFWVVLLMNAVNFVDGLDGLAVGLSGIAGLGIYLYSTRLPSEFLGPAPLAPLLAVVVAGACLGFLPYNFSPARLIMGDTGALTLGFLLAAASISLIERFQGPGAATGRVALPLIFTPIVFLAVPLSDLGFAVLRRLATGRPIFQADHDHIHNRLLRFGHSHRQAVTVLYGWAALLAGGLVAAGAMSWGRFILALSVAGGTVLLLTLAPRLRGVAKPTLERV